MSHMHSEHTCLAVSTYLPAQVDRCFRQAKEVRQAQQQQQQHAASFFAKKWERCNEGTAAAGTGAAAATALKDTAAATLTDQSCTTAAANHSSSSTDNRNGSVSVDCAAVLSSFSCKRSSRLQQLPPRLPAGGGSAEQCSDGPGQRLSWQQRLSNRLLVVLLPFSLGPGILLLSFVLLEVRL